MTRYIKALATVLLLLLTLQSCTLIDDDRSDCENSFSINYQLKVVSNINLQLSEQLQASMGSQTLATLNSYLSPILQPTTSAVHLSFFPTGGSEPIHFDRETQGLRTAFSLSIPADNYRHVAVIGQEDPSIFLRDTTEVRTERLSQFLNDTVDSHNHAALAGTLDMNVANNANQDWEIDLYPADASVAVVMKKNPKVTRIRVFLADLATSFTPNDSTWHWEHNSLVRTDAVDITGTDSVAYCGVAFPSRMEAGKSTDTNGIRAGMNPAPTSESAVDGTIWHVIILADLPDGSVTRTALSLSKALKTGDIRVIRVKLNDDGGVSTTDSNVGASVTLDWKKGGEYNPEI